ncbi:MAG: sugar phosphate nucleotidyltransferase [bacterium]
MEEFLGVLFCGGRGVRLGEITRYISKPCIPVYDTPVFRFGLKLLEDSKLISEIIILTNKENDKSLKESGYRTIIQDDSKVNDMFSGWTFIKEVTRTGKHGVLVPGDNICDVKIDNLIGEFLGSNSHFVFSLHKIKDNQKLSQMGRFDIRKNKFYYKNHGSTSEYGVIAPYIINNNLEIAQQEDLFESSNASKIFHDGYWFDIGDYESLFAAISWRRKNKADRF